MSDRTLLGGLVNGQKQITVATAVADCESVDYAGFVSGMIYVPSTSSIATLTFHVARHPDGTYHAARNDDGTAAVIAVAGGNAYPVPQALRGAGAFKMVGDVAGSVDVTIKD